MSVASVRIAAGSVFGMAAPRVATTLGSQTIQVYSVLIGSELSFVE
jgi:hypothetical protein